MKRRIGFGSTRAGLITINRYSVHGSSQELNESSSLLFIPWKNLGLKFTLFLTLKIVNLQSVFTVVDGHLHCTTDGNST